MFIKVNFQNKKQQKTEFNSIKSCNSNTCNCKEKFKVSNILQFNNEMTSHEQKNFILNCVIQLLSQTVVYIWRGSYICTSLCVYMSVWRVCVYICTSLVHPLKPLKQSKFKLFTSFNIKFELKTPENVFKILNFILKSA